MAGQPQPPQDGSWQSGLERARAAAWQQEPPYEPLPETARHPVQSYDAPPPGDQGYPPPQHPYAAGRPQGYAPGGPGYESADQQTPFDLAGQQAEWQPGQARAQGRPAAPRGKGFIASLFDFGFTSFVTPKLVKALYVLAVMWTAVVAIFLTLVGFNINSGAGWSMLILVVPVYVLLSLAGTRVFLELLMGLHRINDNIQAIRDRDQGQL